MSTSTLLTDPPGVLVAPELHCGTGVLTVRGSSGAVDADRARLLAEHGALAMSIQWMGGPGQQPGPWHVPLETFTAALDRLAPECDRLALVGASFGAEAALLTAALDDRVDAVVGCAPSSVAWAGVPDGSDEQLSHWTWRTEPVPFVPLDEAWRPTTDPPAYAECYRTSLRTNADRVPAATIPVEQIRGDVVLVAGGDDQVWPSADFAEAIAARRRTAGLATTVVSHPGAGHYLQFPGEPEPVPGRRMARGGTPAAAAALGALAWPYVVEALRLHP